MKIAGRSIAAALSLLVLAGCSAWQTDRLVTPTTYTASRELVPRNVGKLRRLAAIAIHQERPPICSSGSGAVSFEFDAPAYRRAAAYLTQQKGYEVVELDPTEYAQWLCPEVNSAFLLELADWSANTRGDSALGAETRSLLAQIRNRKSADGLLLFHIHFNCDMGAPESRALMAVVTLGMNEIVPVKSSLEVHLSKRIAIIEIDSERAVWRTTRTEQMTGFHSGFWSGDRNRSEEESIFQDLETATPEILTR